MKQLAKNTSFILVALILLASCRLFKKNTSTPNFFVGSIKYDVLITAIDQPSSDMKTKIDLLGSKMILTVYPNGDIQKTYKGSTSFGYEAEYLKLDKNLVFQKYNSSDSILSRDAANENMIKISDVRVDGNEVVTVLGMPCQTTAIGIQEISSIDKKRSYATLYYSYNDSISIDKTKYAQVNDNLWAYLLDESNGAIFLKYELLYSTYKVTYTATKIAPGEYPSADENLILVPKDYKN